MVDKVDIDLSNNNLQENLTYFIQDKLTEKVILNLKTYAGISLRHLSKKINIDEIDLSLLLEKLRYYQIVERYIIGDCEYYELTGKAENILDNCDKVAKHE